MAGLTRKKVKVRSKSGKTYQRSVMVRAGSAVKRVGSFLNRNKGRIAAGAAVIGLGALAAHHGIKNASAIHGTFTSLRAAAGSMKDRGEKSRFQHLREHATKGFMTGHAADKALAGQMAMVRAANNMHHATGRVSAPSEAVIQSMSPAPKAKRAKAKKRK